MRERREENGVLVASLEGCEGQVWRDGALLASRWWPQAPEAGEWRNFLRDAGSTAQIVGGTPALQPDAWLERPWAASAASTLVSSTQGAAERWTVTLATLCLAGATFWYGAQMLKLENATAEQKSELDNLNQSGAAVLEARGQALEALDRIKQLQALVPYPPQLGLLAKAAEALPRDGAYLREWDFQNGKLKFQVASPNKLAGSDIIKQLQSAGIFDNVLTAAGNEPNNMALTMEVRPQSVITFAAEAAPTPLKKDGDKLPVLVPPLR